MLNDYGQAREWLESFIPKVYGKEELGLARIEELLLRLGNPEKKFKSVHVAGTSGKGSTAFYTARLLQYSAYQWVSESVSQKVSEPVNQKTEPLKHRNTDSQIHRITDTPKIALHVSPHLSYIGERMQVNGRPIGLRRFIRLIGEMRLVVEQIQREKPELTPSYFEILVAASFLYFAQEKVDWAVVEVGLGGRLDATNVLTPEVSVITNVGLDHTDILGKTVEKIAFEKAGIVKRSVPVVTGAKGRALSVIRSVAKQKNALLVSVLSSKYYVFGIPSHCTQETAKLAIKTVETLGFRPTKAQIKEVFSVGFPGRFEEVMPGVILDGAHNPDKIRSLIEFVRKFKVQNAKFKVTLVIGFKKGKDWKKMVDMLLKNLPVKQVIATEFKAVTDTGKFAAVNPKEIADYIYTKYKIPDTKYYTNSQEAVFAAIQDTILLGTGSLYLVGEVRTMWYLPGHQ